MTEETRKKCVDVLKNMDQTKLSLPEIGAISFAIESLSKDIPAQEWKEYPKNKPITADYYLVTYTGQLTPEASVGELFYDGDEWESIPKFNVTAFTNLPDPHTLRSEERKGK